MQFPELMAFKFFFWKRSLLAYPEMARLQFTDGETDAETAAAAKRITDLYCQIPSTEIRNEENVYCTIRQIEYYRQSNIFADNSMVLKVYSQLEDLLNHIEVQAEAEKKFLVNHSPNSFGAPYKVYINECILGNNTIFVQSDERNITFLNHNGLNALATQDKLFCDYTVKNLQNIILKLTQVGIAGEKERSMFFNYLRCKIYEKKKAIMSQAAYIARLVINLPTKINFLFRLTPFFRKFFIIQHHIKKMIPIHIGLFFIKFI